MYTVVAEHVFPFLRTLGGDDSTYAHHMKDARFTIPTPALLAKVVDMLDHAEFETLSVPKTVGTLFELPRWRVNSARTLVDRWKRFSKKFSITTSCLGNGI